VDVKQDVKRGYREESQYTGAGQDQHGNGNINYPGPFLLSGSFRREYAAMVGEIHMQKARLEAAVGRELDGAAPIPGETAPPKTKNSDGEGR